MCLSLCGIHSFIFCLARQSRLFVYCRAGCTKQLSCPLNLNIFHFYLGPDRFQYQCAFMITRTLLPTLKLNYLFLFFLINSSVVYCKIYSFHKYRLRNLRYNLINWFLWIFLAFWFPTTFFPHLKEEIDSMIKSKVSCECQCKIVMLSVILVCIQHKTTVCFY